MAAGARLTALSAVAIASVLVVMTPLEGTTGLAYLVGALGVLSLAVGLLAGSRSLVNLGVSALVVQIALSILLEGSVRPPLWVQAGGIGAVIELSSLSFTWREWPVHRVVELGRIAATVVGIMVATSMFETITAGVEAGGVIGRVAGVVGLVVATGLVAWLIGQRLSPGRPTGG